LEREFKIFEPRFKIGVRRYSTSDLQPEKFEKLEKNLKTWTTLIKTRTCHLRPFSACG